MPMEGDEFVFPDEKEEKETKAEKPESKDDDIEIVDDTPEKDKGRKPPINVDDPSEEELAEYSAKVKGRINELTRARHDERVARERIEREHTEALRLAQLTLEENKQLKQQLTAGSTSLQSATKTLAEKEIDAAKAKLRAAHEAFDVDAITEAQAALTAAQVKLDRVSHSQQQSLQSKKEEGYTAPTGQPPATQRGPDARAKAWMSKNTWFGQDDEMSSFALGVHAKLVKQGVDTQSDEYYEKLDNRLREVFPTKFGVEKREESRKSGTVVAPVSRATSGNRVKLTQTQVAIAKRLNVPLEQYARHVAELERKNG